MHNYQKDVKPDIYNLHLEWEKQPGLSVQYGELYSQATSKREKQELLTERKKDEIKEEAGKLDKEIRLNWKDYDFKSKPTDATIKAAIPTQSSYKQKQQEYYDAVDKLIELKEEENTLKAVYYSFQDRKAALEWAGRLFLAGYFSELKVKEDEQFGMKERE